MDLSNINPARGHNEIRRSMGHIMVTTRWPNQQGSKSRQSPRQVQRPKNSRPKPCASLKNAPGILPVRRSLLALEGRKQVVVRYHLSLRKLMVRAFDSCAQGFSTPLVRRRSSCLPPSPNLVLTHSIERATVRLRVLLHPTRLSATAPPAS